MSHAFETWWILDQLRGSDGCVRAQRKDLHAAYLALEETHDEVEPALAVLAASGLWEQAADDENPLPEDSIPSIERALKAIRMVLRQS